MQRRPALASAKSSQLAGSGIKSRSREICSPIEPACGVLRNNLKKFGRSKETWVDGVKPGHVLAGFTVTVRILYSGMVLSKSRRNSMFHNLGREGSTLFRLVIRIFLSEKSTSKV
jgi:hypothetical protein